MNSKILRSYIRQIIKETTFMQEKERQVKTANRQIDKEFDENKIEQIAQNIIMSHGNVVDRDGQDGWRKIVDRKVESEKTYGRSLDGEKLMNAIEKKIKDYGLKVKFADLKTRYKDGYGGAN